MRDISRCRGVLQDTKWGGHKASGRSWRRHRKGQFNDQVTSPTVLNHMSHDHVWMTYFIRFCYDGQHKYFACRETTPKLDLLKCRFSTCVDKPQTFKRFRLNYTKQKLKIRLSFPDYCISLAFRRLQVLSQA